MRGRFTQALQRTPSVRSDRKKLAGFVYQTSDDSVRIAKREAFGESNRINLMQKLKLHNLDSQTVRHFTFSFWGRFGKSVASLSFSDVARDDAAF